MILSRDGIIGVAIGDAMGLPVQFNRREYFKTHPVTEMLGHMVFDMPKGSWSDDTSMTLATVDAIIKDKDVNIKTITDNFVKWLCENEYTPTGKAYDIGNTCMKAVMNYAKGKATVENCGLTGDMDNGNGSLMRILPISYFCNAKKLSEEEIYNVVKSVSSITHAHEVSVMGCFIYVLFAIELLNDKSFNEAYEEIQKVDYADYFSENAIDRYKRVLNGKIQNEEEDDISTSGYVLHTLEATFWVILNTSSYDEAILKTVNLGEDTDSVGACVGGLAGIYYGLESINKDWRNSLIKFDEIEEMCKRFDEALK